ncbi:MULTISPECIES: hypothetical protein [unclassified Bartonella]|uniref:hypothetical protein n=1 Tax=unclassified Bartonella TaxID=2645622 RepID=UPI0035CF52C9
MSRSLSTYTHHNNVFADHDAFVLYSEEGVKAVVPQVSTYLSMPHALFQVGLMDMNNHKKQLETLRIAAGALGENGKKSRTFCARLRWKLSLCF